MSAGRFQMARLLLGQAVRELGAAAAHAAGTARRLRPHGRAARPRSRHLLVDRLGRRVSAETVDIQPHPWVAALICTPISPNEEGPIDG
ncbi:hypothetical protein [Actinomadura sp. WAC 06369]|uniref:hypothetical protein n=1 Tax=Actinomadura sp. WAC 06369 TaxID=2203193 RepID=UPI000F76C17D|nr:hypothetical protein [Actinomadura sp. WAC 06369]RSN53313.1 hypothetical protein DMH08_27670 [Actinomadura sp. WAC 06369]